MRKIGFLLVLVLLLSVLPITAQEELPEFISSARTPCEVDLTGQTFNFAHIGDLSGAYAFITQPVLAAFADATAYFNERGGICGATIALPDPTTVDTGGNPEQTQVIYDRVSAESPKMLVLYASGDAELLRDQVAEDEIPVLISAGSVAGLYGTEGNEPGWIFASNPLYADQFGHFCQYAAENIESPVIGYISWAGAFGSAAYTPEAIAFCEGLGVDVLDTPEYFLPTDTDISGAVQNLVDAGANILYTNSLATGPALVAATVTSLGLNDSVQIAGVNWALDSSVGLLGLQSIAPNGAPSVNGLIGSMPFAWWTERDNAGIQLITEIADANERAATVRNIAYILGFITIDSYIEVMVQTANRVGSGDFTGADVYETMQGIDYNSLNVIDIDFTNDAGEPIRAGELNRMAVLTYAGVDGGTILDGQAPLMVDLPDGRSIPVPVVVPLEEFRNAPDLRPGGADAPAADG
jgi:ABC-type branched-subunit amino acid transport system substrate-binding protein